MDCGPASLKCLLEGFGTSVSYGRLREACQTDVDGTSIDTMEEIAAQLGLAAEQIMVPADHVLLPEASLLPAIVATLEVDNRSGTETKTAVFALDWPEAGTRLLRDDAERALARMTRIGFGSKAVITGDVTQVDLPAGKRSGLIEAERVLKNLAGIEFVYFTEKDVVRHHLVQMIVQAYDRNTKTKFEDKL